MSQAMAAPPQRAWAASLLYFWFNKLGPQDWWGGSAKVDRHLQQHFERWLIALHKRPAREFLSDPHTALAAILLFDQAPRNLYSGTARAFAFDALARQLTNAMMARGWDKGLTRVQRQFMALPLMHSEAMADQLQSMAYYTLLGPRGGLDFARSHYTMIARFGRYPHRNAALGRVSSPAEIRAIEAGNSW